MPQTESLNPEPNAPLTVEDFCFLANTFAEQHEFGKAAQIYESACKLFPGNLALKINLGRVRSMKAQALDSPKDILPKMTPSDLSARKTQHSNRFQGLGEVFVRNGRTDEAQRIFELSKTSDPGFYLPYLNLGRLHLSAGDIAGAIRELDGAVRLNPFSDEAASLLSEARAENRDYEEALNAAIDAFILSGEASNPATRGPHRSRVKTLMTKISGFTNKMRNEKILERRSRIQSLFEELEAELQLKTARVGLAAVVAPENAPAPPPAQSAEDAAEKNHETATLLRRHLMFRNMDEESVLKVAGFTSEIQVLKSDLIYQEGDPIYGIYLVNRGKVEIQKTTPYGPIVFASFEKGSFFGDDNLLSGRQRVTTAISTQDSDLLFIDKAGLAHIFAREKAIAIHFLWYIWKSLSFQIREANSRMTSFFTATSKEARKELKAQTATGGTPVSMEINKKLEVLHAKGLNKKELSLLEKFSSTELYNRGELIFREGDLGDRLYIVLEGSVMISKNIPGAGDEALALLKAGDFFGEMALVGQHHRSADAKAQDQGTTVLVISKEALREILSIDTDSAYQFLTILCRILSQRLIEINEKIYQWRMMSGEFR